MSLSHGVTPSTILSLVRDCRCLNEREVTARSFLLPPVEPITARWAVGDLMSKLSAKLGQNNARSWRATGVSIRTNTAVRPARYLKVCASSHVLSVLVLTKRQLNWRTNTAPERVEVRLPVGAADSHWLWGHQSRLLWAQKAFHPRVNRPAREADHSHVYCKGIE
jgi:hypothetical protein